MMNLAPLYTITPETWTGYYIVLLKHYPGEPVYGNEKSFERYDKHIRFLESVEPGCIRKRNLSKPWPFSYSGKFSPLLLRCIRERDDVKEVIQECNRKLKFC